MPELILPSASLAGVQGAVEIASQIEAARQYVVIDGTIRRDTSDAIELDKRLLFKESTATDHDGSFLRERSERGRLVIDLSDLWTRLEKLGVEHTARTIRREDKTSKSSI